MSAPRIIAVDWSGAKKREREKIWLAEVRAGELVRLESGRTREEITQHLIEEARADPALVVGLDFAFSLPAWFLRERGLGSAAELWGYAERHGEAWMGTCDPPFWGRPGRTRPELPGHFRDTEEQARHLTLTRPKSVFQIGGAGAVGTGSVRGMPSLARLARGGFSIWPFDPPALPLIVEIYPRLLTGAVVKSSADARRSHLGERHPGLPPGWMEVAASSEDAFDAAVSALVMVAHADDFSRLPAPATDRQTLEGLIWHPGIVAGTGPENGTRLRDTGRDPSETTKEGAIACPFCSLSPDQIVAENGYARAFRDRYPIAEGHTLVVPRRHVESLFELPQAELASVWDLVRQARAELEQRTRPDGFTIGINDGPDAGQTIGHAHAHVIPRRRGDVPDPRGGIRWVIPEKAPYWREGA